MGGLVVATRLGGLQRAMQILEGDLGDGLLSEARE